MFTHPCIERGLRLLQQCRCTKSRFFSSQQRQLPGHFVERSRHGDHYFLLRQRCFRVRLIPSRSQVPQILRRSLHRRDSRNTLRRGDRQNRVRAIHTGMRQPALGRSHQPPCVFNAPLSRELAHNAVWQQACRELVRASQVQKRRQQRFRPHFARVQNLRNRKRLNRTVLRKLSKCQCRIRGSQIDPNYILRFSRHRLLHFKFSRRKHAYILLSGQYRQPNILHSPAAMPQQPT